EAKAMASSMETLGERARGWRPAKSGWRRRASEAGGALLFVLALLLALALLTYNPADPTWNHAESAPVHNWIGPHGADIADLLFQVSGFAAAILPLVLFAWSFRLLAGRGLGAIWVRLGLLPPTLMLAAMA